MTKLDISEEQYAEFKESEFVLICSYRNGNTITRAWIDEIGTKEECEEAQELLGCSFYVVPQGLTIHSEIVATDQITLPEGA